MHLNDKMLLMHHPSRPNVVQPPLLKISYCSPVSACWHYHWSSPQMWWCSFFEWDAQSCWREAWSGPPQPADPQVSSLAHTDVRVCSRPQWAGTAWDIPQNPPAEPSDQTCNHKHWVLLLFTVRRHINLNFMTILRLNGLADFLRGLVSLA